MKSAWRRRSRRAGDRHDDVHLRHDLGREAGLPDARELGGERVGSALALGLDLNERWLCTMPLAHVGGLSILLRSTAVRDHGGAPRPVRNRGGAGRLMDAGSPDHARVAGADDARPAARCRTLDPPTLRWALLGGRPDPAGHARARGGSRGVPVASTYGMTETCSQIATFGVPLHGVELRFVDGEIHVRGPIVSPAALAPTAGYTPATSVSSIRAGACGSRPPGRHDRLGR